MEYQVIADHELAIDAGAFRAAWNNNQRSAQVAAASAVGPDAQVYDGGLTLLLAVLGGIATGVATNLLTDLIKEAIDKAAGSRKQDYEIVIEEKKDGTRIIRIRKES